MDMNTGQGPLHVYWVRHGESEGNLNRLLYQTKADHAMRLSPAGVEQGKGAGRFLSTYLKQEQDKDLEHFGKIRVWYSSYYRARETAFHILQPLGQQFDTTPGTGVLSYRETPFLIEQKNGLFDGLDDETYITEHPHAGRDWEKHVKYNGRTYAILPQGESRLDVAIRVEHFCQTILEDYHARGINHVVAVNHGATLRAGVMDWMGYTPEWIDAERNPGNGWIRHTEGLRSNGCKDHGYIYGEGAPLHDPMAMQKRLENAHDIYMLAPHRPDLIVPYGMQALDPFAKNDSLK